MNPLRFPGQYADKETNTYYNINRDYDPAIGRYVESDPVGLYGGSASTYTYVNSNPLSYADPFGLALCSIDLQQLIQNAYDRTLDASGVQKTRGGGGCANAVRLDLQNSGGPTLPPLGQGGTPSPAAWGPALLNSGCYQLVRDPSNYTPQPGDIAITVGVGTGHASIYDGSSWDADIATKNASPNTTNPDSPYHGATPTIYQYIGNRN